MHESNNLCTNRPNNSESQIYWRTRQELQLRLYNHVKKAQSNRRRNKRLTHKENWIMKLQSYGTQPIIKKLCVVEGWKQSHLVEQSLINKHRVKHD